MKQEESNTKQNEEKPVVVFNDELTEWDEQAWLSYAKTTGILTFSPK